MCEFAYTVAWSAAASSGRTGQKSAESLSVGLSTVSNFPHAFVVQKQSELFKDHLGLWLPSRTLHLVP